MCRLYPLLTFEGHVRSPTPPVCAGPRGAHNRSAAFRIGERRALFGDPDEMGWQIKSHAK